MKVRFHAEASRELDLVYAWVAEDSPRAALALIARIETKVMRLANPGLAYMGRPGLVDGTRELVEGPYIIVYKVDEDRDEIVVISVVHGARDREPE